MKYLMGWMLNATPFYIIRYSYAYNLIQTAVSVGIVLWTLIFIYYWTDVAQENKVSIEYLDLLFGFTCLNLN